MNNFKLSEWGEPQKSGTLLIKYLPTNKILELDFGIKRMHYNNELIVADAWGYDAGHPTDLNHPDNYELVGIKGWVKDTLYDERGVLIEALEKELSKRFTKHDVSLFADMLKVCVDESDDVDVDSARSVSRIIGKVFNDFVNSPSIASFQLKSLRKSLSADGVAKVDALKHEVEGFFVGTCESCAEDNVKVCKCHSLCEKCQNVIQ